MSLMAPTSQEMLVSTLELMSLINTRLMIDVSNSNPKFEPDITQLAVSGRQSDALRKLLNPGENIKPSAKPLPMKLKTQQLFA